MAEGLARRGRRSRHRRPQRREGQRAARARSRRPAAAHGFTRRKRRSKAELESLLDAVLQRSGRVDIVVNGAGVNSATPFFDIAEEEFDRIVRVNLKGVFFGCQVFGKHLVEAGQGGSIINIGSMSGARAAVSRVHVLGDQERRAQSVAQPCARVGAASRARQRARARASFPPSRIGRFFSPSASPKSWATRRWTDSAKRAS